MNVTDLRDHLITVYNQLKDNEIGMQEAKGLANVAGKIISTGKSQMEYNKMVGSKTRIKFFEDDK